MWMDCFILLPLVILGLDRLIEKDKIGIYIICLTLSILVNFYIGFTVCIFSFLYFIYKCYVMNNFKLKVIKSFVISSLLCGLMSCIVLIPQVYSLMAGRGNTFSLEALKGINWFTLLTLPVNFVTGTFSKSRSLAGMRIGYAIGSKALISVLEAVKNSYNSYTVNSLSMAVGTAAIRDEKYFSETVSKVIKTRERVTKELISLGFKVLGCK